jgi:hypothetical protein
MNPQLNEYIEQQLAAGASREELKKRLLESGWNEDEIEQGFLEVEKPVIPSPAPLPEAEPESKPEPEKPAEIVHLDMPQIDIHQQEAPNTEIPSVTSAYGTPEPREMISPDIRVDATSKRNAPNAMLVLVIVAILAGILGIGTWLIYQRVSKNFFGDNATGSAMINPSAEPTTVPSPVPTSVAGKPYNNDTYGFNIVPPQNWRTDESGTSGIIVNFLNTAPDADNGNKFAANINVVSENVGNVNLDNYVGSSKKVLMGSFTNYTVVTERNIVVGEKPAVLIESTYEMGIYSLHNLQLFIVNNQKAYVVTATALSSAWNNYFGQMNASVMSFRLK